MIFIGSFDSEKFWKDSDYTLLPTIYDPQSEAILSVLDEMQFVFCENKDDVLLTRFPINSYFKSYLNDCGFRFICNNRPVTASLDSEIKNENIFRLFNQTNNIDYFKNLIPRDTALSPFSILPDIKSFCTQFKLKYDFPDLNTIRAVNSKVYASNISRDLFNSFDSKIVTSAKDIYIIGEKFLKKNKPFLIKDPLGVSGKGILSIGSLFLLKRLCYFIEKQENNRKKTLFLMEPVLDKEKDFSCQIDITKDGNIKIISLHINKLIGYKHSECRYIDNDFSGNITNDNYLEKIELIGLQLHQSNYFGPVCIDSMKLRDGSIRYIVEINVRKSMTLFNHFIRKKFLAVQDSLMIQLNLTFQKVFSIEEFIHLLESAKLLFDTKKYEGILPLSGNALIVNSYKNALPYKAMLFAVIMSPNYSKTCHIYERLKKLLNENKVIINK